MEVYDIMECMCAACRRACEENPGWMTPDEAEAAIKAGLASKLMRDWLEPSKLGNDDRIFVICPASEGYEGEDAPEMGDEDGGFVSMFVLSMYWTKGRCTLLTKDGKCSIHDSGFKPIHCRLAMACKSTLPSDFPDNYAVAGMWNTDHGRAVVESWQRAVS